jgi:hypothetical protein
VHVSVVETVWPAPFWLVLAAEEALGELAEPAVVGAPIGEAEAPVAEAGFAEAVALAVAAVLVAGGAPGEVVGSAGEVAPIAEAAGFGGAADSSGDSFCRLGL